MSLAGVADVCALAEADSNPEAALQLVKAVLQEDVLPALAQNVHLLAFEARKDTQSILSHVLRFKAADATSPVPLAIDHVVRHRPGFVVDLCRGYEHRESAMPCGVVLREILKFQEVAVIIFYDEGDGRPFDFGAADYDAPSTGRGVFWQFFPWIDRGAFEVSADAFTTFREIITRHKQTTARFLTANYELFFGKYNFELMKSSSYVTKRQSIKLLGELLLDRPNYNIMISYVADGEHLKLCMNLMKDDRKMVRYEAFHVFKVGRGHRRWAVTSRADTDGHAGVCGEPEQVVHGAEDPDQQPRQAAQVPAGLPGRPHRGRAVCGREELPGAAD